MKEKIKEKGITLTSLAVELEITRPTLYKRLLDNDWKAFQRRILKEKDLL